MTLFLSHVAYLMIRFAYDALNRSTPAMDSLAVMVSPPTTGTVPRSGQRIGLAGMTELSLLSIL